MLKETGSVCDCVIVGNDRLTGVDFESLLGYKKGILKIKATFLHLAPYWVFCLFCSEFLYINLSYIIYFTAFLNFAIHIQRRVRDVFW